MYLRWVKRKLIIELCISNYDEFFFLCYFFFIPHLIIIMSPPWQNKLYSIMISSYHPPPYPMYMWLGRCLEPGRTNIMNIIGDLEYVLMVCDRNDYCRLKAVTNNKFSLYSKIKKKILSGHCGQWTPKKKKERNRLSPPWWPTRMYIYVCRYMERYIQTIEI